jgi:hypothetical protein
MKQIIYQNVGKDFYLSPQLSVINIAYESTIAASATTDWNNGSIPDSDIEDLGNF